MYLAQGIHESSAGNRLMTLIVLRSPQALRRSPGENMLSPLIPFV